LSFRAYVQTTDGLPSIEGIIAALDPGQYAAMVEEMGLTALAAQNVRLPSGELVNAPMVAERLYMPMADVWGRFFSLKYSRQLYDGALPDEALEHVLVADQLGIFTGLQVWVDPKSSIHETLLVGRIGSMCYLIAQWSDNEHDTLTTQEALMRRARRMDHPIVGPLTTTPVTGGAALVSVIGFLVFVLDRELWEFFCPLAMMPIAYLSAMAYSEDDREKNAERAYLTVLAVAASTVLAGIIIGVLSA